MDRYGSYSLKAALESDVSAAKGGLQRVTVAESFGHVSNSYPREYRALSPDVVTLERAAEITSGTTDPSPATLFDPAGDFVTRDVSLWPRFVGAALALFLLDVFVRRVRFSGRPLLPTRAAPAASAHP